MTTETFLAFIVAATVLIIIPGPTNMVVVSSALRFGLIKSFWTVLGAALSHAVFFSITFTGLATILLTSAAIFEWIRWIGVGYLIWLGIRQWTSHISPMQGNGSQADVSAWSLLLQGFAVNTTNPKALVFYAAFFPPFVNPNSPVVPQLVLMAMVFIAIFVIVAAIHSFTAEKARTLMTDPRHVKLTNRIAGSFLIGAGVLLAAARDK